MEAPFALRCDYRIDPLGLDEPRPRFSWQLRSDGRGALQSAYQIVVTSTPGDSGAGPVVKWDSGVVASERSVNILYAGAPLTSGEACTWRVRVWDQDGKSAPFSAPASFEMGLLSPSDWKGRWIGAADRSISSPLLRREFALDASVLRARVHVSGLGFYELYVNGQKVGDRVLDPATTYYSNDQPFSIKDRVLYVTHDITHMLHVGPNVVGVMLGRGWYAAEHDVPQAPGHHTPYGDRPQLLLQMSIALADGRAQSIASDESWTVASGPILYNEFCDGETYDARRERPGWAMPGCDGRDWQPATLVEGPSGRLVAQTMPPERIVETIRPVGLHTARKGMTVFDLGQSIAGWSRLHVRGPAGRQVVLKHGACLYPDGTLDARSSLRPGDPRGYARQTDTYVLKGEGEETWEPRFTLHGFRYVEMTGYPGEPTPDSLEGRVVHTDVERSSFSCSNPLLNRIHSNAMWTLRGSLQGMPQDAADRAERLAWLGDPGFIAEDYLYSLGTASFWTKWLDDIRDSQKPDGSLPVVSPIHWRTTWDPYIAWPDWQCTFPLYVWHVYWHYGDAGILERHYEGVRAFVDFVSSTADHHIVRAGLGDHMEPQEDGTTSFAPQHTPAALTSTAYYYEATRILADAARVLGQTGDAERYGALAQEIRAAFNREFLSEATNQYATGSQTANALALCLGLVPAGREVAVTDNLVADIAERHDGHLTTGIIGTSALERALPAYGRADVMYGLATQTTHPSWGAQILRGATTIWETWDGDPEAMFSLNMKMFSSVEVFFFKTLAGIAPASPGYRNIAIKPTPVGDLTHVQATVETVRGPVVVDWEKRETGLALDVTIPGNVTAAVCVPKLDLCGVTITESGRTIWRDGKFIAGAPGILAGRDAGAAVEFEVGSGAYAFESAGRPRARQ